METAINLGLNNSRAIIQSQLRTAFGAIDNLLNDVNAELGKIDNNVEDPINDIINWINNNACIGGSCFNTVNIPNISISSLDNAIGRDITIPSFNVSLAVLNDQLEEAAPFSDQMCTNTNKINEYASYIKEIMPEDIKDATHAYDYDQAEEFCAIRGGHVCSTSEIFILADDSTPNSIGYQAGDWVDGGGVVASPTTSVSGVFETPWPPVSADVGSLLAIPPGLPLEMSVPVLPTGSYRCCMSTGNF